MNTASASGGLAAGRRAGGPRPGIRCLGIVLGIVVLSSALGLAALAVAGRWLANSDTPEAADAIVVLAGEPTRALYAAELFARRLAPVVHVSRPALSQSQRMFKELGIAFPGQEELMREVLVRKGVPADRIRYLGASLLSTAEEAAAVDRLGIGGERVVLVVTSPYHVRRVKLVFGGIAPSLRFVVVANPHESYPARWWTDQDVARNVLLELAKIAFFAAGGRFTAEPVVAGAR